MKLCSALLALAFSFCLFHPSVGRAETAEARGAVVLRNKASTGGKVVGRAAAGTKLTVLEFSDDGNWVRVRAKGTAGWVPIASLRTKGQADEPAAAAAAPVPAPAPAAPASDPAPGESLAKRRNVRGEAWVSKSKYHEEDPKMTVVASKAELFGRPQAGGTVLGFVRRGEVVQFVRRSADKKWVQIDIGAGELAWVEATAVRSGSDMPAADENQPPPRETRREEPPPPPPPPPSQRKTVQPSPDEIRRADRDDTPPPPPPPPPVRKADDRATRERDEKARREEEKARKVEDAKDRREREEQAKRDEEKARRDAEQRERDDRERLARSERDNRDHDRTNDKSSAREDRERRDREERDRKERAREDKRRKKKDAEGSAPVEGAPEHGPNFVDVSLKVGFGRVGETVRTNGTSTSYLANYKQNTTGIAVAAELGYARSFGTLRLNLDAKFAAVLGGSVVFTAADKSSTQLQVLDQEIGAGVAVGGFFHAGGGVDLRLRLGVDSWINQISPSDAPIAISQNVVLGMTIGAVFAMPAFAHIAQRPVGFRLHVGALAPATRLQQPHDITAPHNTTIGGYAGGGLFFGLFDKPHKGQLHLELSYDFSFAFTHFTGACTATANGNRECRDDTVSDANYASAQHIGAIGIYYQY